MPRSSPKRKRGSKRRRPTAAEDERAEDDLLQSPNPQPKKQAKMMMAANTCSDQTEMATMNESPSSEQVSELKDEVKDLHINIQEYARRELKSG